jgi:hypothetical protein
MLIKKEKKIKNCIHAKKYRDKVKDDDDYKEKNQIRCRLYYEKIKNNKSNQKE